MPGKYRWFRSACKTPPRSPAMNATALFAIDLLASQRRFPVRADGIRLAPPDWRSRNFLCSFPFFM
jgi:hypothetical protein